MNKQELLENKCSDCGKPIKKEYERCYPCMVQNRQEQIKSVPETEGEEFLADYFSYHDIKFETQKAIVGLLNDNKRYRIADFYLPEYELYVEFNGYWNDDRDRYLEKMNVYKNNGIPCVYLYPENLGVVDFVLDKRIQKVLEEMEMNDKLNKYRWFKMRKTGQGRMITIVVVTLFLMILIFDSISEHTGLIVFLLLTLAYQSYELIKNYLAIFKHNKFPLSKLDD